ncbi:MAG: ABC transporter ATP-binding protein [Oscillospiraceae bacterium]|jgi:putative ABC transport system ATP-binding protein|nr:ABC transporter ATP-binding protein [Oscillospiraceae bacterium]
MVKKNVLIEVKGIRKVYKMASEKVIALNKIDLAINKGEICCILGTSGSGKSTLLNMMAGLEKPTKGSVIIAGHNVSKMSEKKLAILRQKYIGFVFQSYNLLPSLTAQENVALPLMFKGIGKGKRNVTARKMLKAVKLGERWKHKPNEMSGGQQQRVGIARAFVAKPMVVFADEPTGNLDTKTTKEVMELILGVARDHNQTLVIVTHDRSIASYTDRIITISDGNVVGDEKVEQQVKN